MAALIPRQELEPRGISSYSSFTLGLGESELTALFLFIPSEELDTIGVTVSKSKASFFNMHSNLDQYNPDLAIFSLNI